MRISISLVLCSVLVIQYVSGVDVTPEEWEDYKRQYGKVYDDSAEDQRRLEIYKHTKKDIMEHNKRYEEGKESFEMAINQFADLEYGELPKGVLALLKKKRKNK